MAAPMTPIATAQMPMSQIDAARAAGGYGGSIPRTLPAQASQRAVAAVSGSTQQRLTPPAPPAGAVPTGNVPGKAPDAQQAPGPGAPTQMPAMARGLIGRPMTAGLPPNPLP